MNINKVADKKLAVVVLNEQHKLFPQQHELLDEKFGVGEWELFSVPKEGWKLEDMIYQLDKLWEYRAVVMASVVPALVSLFINRASVQYAPLFYVFHNDKREKKELPNGKIISVVAKEGWKLV